MLLIRCFPLIYLVLSVRHVTSSSNEIPLLKEHFIANLEEETREIESADLTEDVENSINQKIKGFLEIVNEESSPERHRRDTNDLLSEKTEDIFILKGFEDIGFVPVNFPQDICFFKIHETKFAVSLTYGKLGNGTSEQINSTNTRTMAIFLRENKSFTKIREYSSKFLTKIDCKATNDAGFVAVVNTVTENDVEGPGELLTHGSFVYRIRINPSASPTVEVFQRFAFFNQNGVRLYNTHNNNFYVIFSYNTFPSSPLNACTMYKLAAATFRPMDPLPCQNARTIEVFYVDDYLTVLIGNYRGNNGTTNTFSSIMRYDLNQQKFIDSQKILTNAIVVGKYFYLDHQHQRQHFLFIGNSFEINEFGAIDYDVPSMIYKQVNGFFMPMQTISIRHIKAVVPIFGKNEFHLLVASEEREVQIFYYDGWKFHESPIDYTGGSFGAGVVSIRAYDDITNDTVIVISNQEAFEGTPNVYTPHYALKPNSLKLKSSIVQWCTDSFDRLDNYDVSEGEENLKASMELVNPDSDRADFMGKISIKDSNIGTVTTKEFKGTRVVFNKETAERFNALVERVERLAIAVNHVTNKIRFTKATRRSRRQANPLVLIDNLTVDGPMKIQTINGRPVGDLVYKTNSRNVNMRDIVASEILVAKKLFVNGKVDGVEMAEDNVFLDNLDQVLRPMKIENLSVKTISDVTQINSIPTPDFFTLLHRKVDKKIHNSINQLTVESMQIGRFLNERNFSAIAENCLKTTGAQIVSGPMTIGKLTANRILFDKDERGHQISGVALSSLVNINDTVDAAINQDLRFTEDIRVHRLLVQERINNIRVKDGQLQVLRKRGPTSQVVSAEKFFDHVSLKTPIILRGKIESRSLEKMNPIITVNENLVLEGDYRITGPVTIRRALKATEDIKTKNAQLSLKNLLENGLNLLTSNNTGNKLVFNNIVEVRGNLKTVSLNQKPVAHFVRTELPEMQLIKGTTTFTNGLAVSGGTVQADIINEVDLIQLNKTVLKRTSPVTQFIDGNVEIVSLTSSKLLSPNVFVSGKSIEAILNTDIPQELTALNLNQGNIRSLTVQKLQQSQGRRIFGTDLNFLLADTVTTESANDATLIQEKNFNNLKVDHLMFTPENEWKTILTNFENSVAQDLDINENSVFMKPVKIDNLIVKGTINGISYHDMIHNWLQVEKDQVFTAPQVFNSVSIGNKLLLPREMINDVNITKMHEETIWLDQSNSLDNIVINGEAFVKGNVLSPTVNGVYLEEKLLLNNTNEPQHIDQLVVHETFDAEYLDYVKLNGIDCNLLTKAFNSESVHTKLLIRGKVGFSLPTNVTSLNNLNLLELHDNLWMSDIDTVLAGEEIQFLAGARSDGVFYTDTINGRSLNECFEKYISRTRNENIVTHLKVNGTVVINKALSCKKFVVSGAIKSDPNGKDLVIEDFAKNILRLDQEQTISDRWEVNKLVIDGDYDGLVNGMDLYNEVLHLENLDNAVVTGAKRFRLVEADNVYTKYVNEVNISDWYENAVKLNAAEEQIIIGHVDFGQPIFYNGIEVYGPVNNLTFNSETILTKSHEGQVINGDLMIQTMTPQDVRTSFIERLFLLYGINDKNVTDMFLNTLKPSDKRIESSHIVFEKQIYVGSIEADKSIYGVNIGDFLKNSESSNKLMRFQKNLEHLVKQSESLNNCFSETVIELNHFEYHQSLYGVNIQKTVPLAIKGDLSIINTIAVLERNTAIALDVIKFHHWIPESQGFSSNSSISPLEFSLSLYQVTKLDKVVYKGVDHLFFELFDKSRKLYIQNLMAYDIQRRNFVTALATENKFSVQFFTLDEGNTACYGSIFPSFVNLNIICEAQPPTVLTTTAAIKTVSSHNGIIILLTDDHQLQIWHMQKTRQVLNIMNAQSFTSILYNRKYYLAVTSEKVEQSIHHGSLEIFESGSDLNFRLVQSFELENPFTVKFSIVPSGDLLLYTLTKNPSKALCIFKYAGASNFLEIIDRATIINSGSDLSTIKVDGIREFLAIVSGEVFIIEAVFQEY